MSKSASHSRTYRQALPADIEGLESCRQRAIRACPGYTSKQLLIWAESVPDWSWLIPHTILVEVDGTIAGFCSATVEELLYLYVAPEFQQQGIAGDLVSKMERPGMRCDCNPHSARTLAKRGWEHVAVHLKTKGVVTFENAWYRLS